MDTKNDKYSILAKNSAIFAIGTFGSRVLQFLIVPLYTYVLSTTEYGKIDLFTSTISLWLPFVTLLIQESIIRFLTAKEITEQEAINIGFNTFLCSCFFSLIASIIYGYLFHSQFVLLFFVCLILNSYIAIFQNYLKACDQVQAFTISGLLNTFLFLTGNVLMLTVFKAGILGYFYSMLFSLVCTSIYITLKARVLINIRVGYINYSILKMMLKYSLPLIPNNLMWWIMNAGDKYVINFYLGDSANGIYSVSIKLATILSTIFGIFMQAWQLSAIKEKGDENTKNFYNKVYVTIMALLLTSSTIIITFTKILFIFVFSKSYFDANTYSPLLCVATIINCLATFVGTTYIVNKNTKKAFSTTVIGALVNVVLNIILIKPFGLAGVAIGTIVGYIVVLILRIMDMKRFLDMNFDWGRSICSMLIVTLLSTIYIYIDVIQTIILGLLCTVVLTYLYRREHIELIKRLVSYISNR